MCELINISQHIIRSSYLVMEFASFADLQSLKELVIPDYNQFGFELSHEIQQAPCEFSSILNEIQQINQARSMTCSLMQAAIELSDENFTAPEFESKDVDDQQTIFTPTKIMINQSRRSTIFSSDSHSSMLMPVSPSPGSTIKVYYFNKPTCKMISFTQNSTAFELTSKALMEYAQDLSLDQTVIVSKDPKNYEMRFVKEEGSCEADYSVQAISRDRIIADTLIQVLVLVKICKNRKVSAKGFREIQAQSQKSDSIKLHIFNEANMLITTLTMSKTETLQKAFDFLQAQYKQKIVLLEDVESDLILPEDIEISNLGTYKLFAKKKKFLDEPEIEKAPLRIRAATLPKDVSSSVFAPIGITQASRYEQFEVIKINRRGAEQPRIIGFDQTKYYNYDPSVRKKNQEVSLFKALIGNSILTGTKKPERLISDIVSVSQLSETSFEIVLPEKAILFKTDTTLKRDKILRKLNFLVEFNKTENH